MNKVILIGNVGKKPEIKTFGETKIAEFSLAVNKKVKGEDKTTWLNCKSFNKLAELIEKYVDKGSKIAVVGEIEISKYEDKYYTNILINEIEFLSKSENNNAQNQKQTPFNNDELPY